MRLRIFVSRALLAMTAALSLVVSAYAADPIYTKDGLGLSGYDAVSYLTEGKPVKGSEQFEHQWGGVRWRFASAAHRDALPDAITRADRNWPGVLEKASR